MSEPRVLDTADVEEIVDHFHRTGWVAVDALDADTAASLPAWADEVASWPENGRCLQHFEATDSGRVLARAEYFTHVHAGFADLVNALCPLASMLLGEPAVLYKEKINYKAPGGAGFSPHQDAPAYPLVDRHVSAMVTIDSADEHNGCLEVVSGAHDRLWPADERGCVRADVVDSMTWEPVPLPAGVTLWFHSRTPHRSGPNRSDRPRRALYPTYNAASEGDLREAYYETKLAAFNSPSSSSERARVSLIDDFEGRPA